MKCFARCLLFAAIVAAAIGLGLAPQIVYEQSGAAASTSYTIEELWHDPAASWTQTTKLTDDEDWIVEARGSDGMPARFYVPSGVYDELRVGQVIQPPEWPTSDPNSYEFIECCDPRDPPSTTP